MATLRLSKELYYFTTSTIIDWMDVFRPSGNCNVIGIFTIFAAKLHSLALSFTERSDL